MSKKEDDKESSASTRMSFFRAIEGPPALKHIVRVQSMLDRIDSQRRIYPNGVLGTLKEIEEKTTQLTRIEIFADDEEKDTFGIIRKLSVAYSSEKCLLELAQASNSVISIRAFAEAGHRRQEARMIEDTLILKRTEYETETLFYRTPVPNLLVSSQWLDRMNLEQGDRILVSNTVENFVVPPPGITTNSK